MAEIEIKIKNNYTFDTFHEMINIIRKKLVVQVTVEDKETIKIKCIEEKKEIEDPSKSHKDYICKIKRMYKAFLDKLIDDFYLYLSLKSCDETLKIDFKDDNNRKFVDAIIKVCSLQAVYILDPEEMYYEIITITSYEEKENLELSESNNFTEENIKMTYKVCRKQEYMGLFLNEYKDKKNVILLCIDYMESFVNELEKDDKQTIPKVDEILLGLVFSHELGHLIFSEKSSSYKNIQERQANLISSYLFGGLMDKHIEVITKNQLEEYKNPLLISNRYNDTEKFTNELNELYK